MPFEQKISALGRRAEEGDVMDKASLSGLFQESAEIINSHHFS